MAEIDTYLKFMVRAGASDFHMSSGVRPMYRVNGTMVATTAESRGAFTSDETESLLREILPARNLSEYQQANDTDFSYELEGLGRFRVNVFRDRRGTGAVFRHIPDEIMTLDQLGLPPSIRSFCSLEKGLVLVTGPTGSGKSTTLAAMVDTINENRRDHIVTIEDPIEFVHENRGCLVNQREVHTHTGGFKPALRAALREDPDIVLVGEMRDLETTEIAIETAETGHLVLGTLHTTTASSTVDRIIDQFPPNRQAQIRTMLSMSLKGVVSQTLLPRKDRNGRVGAFEILVVTAGIAHNIREGKTHQIPSAIQTGGRLGMQMLNAHLFKLVRDGMVEPQVAYGKSVDRADMATLLRSGGYDVTV